MALMGLREYARHRGCTLRAVQKAILAGRIVLVGENKKIDCERADRDWELNTDAARRSLLHGPGPAPVASGFERDGDGLDAAPAADGGAGTGTGESIVDEHSPIFRRARAEQMAIRVAREQIELDQLRGSLIGLEEARRLAFTAFRTLRDAVLNVPIRVKDQCAAESDSFRVEQMLEDELTKALQIFDPAKVLAEGGDDEGD